jgi:hypothetical protein
LLDILREVEETMSTEFQKVGPNSATSAAGFTVVWHPPGGVDYMDAHGTVRVDAEVLGNPPRILVYPRSGGLKGITDDRAEEILANLIRALEYLGHRVERW